jgi:hypothetical protein
LKNGNARTRRSAQDIAKKYSFPIVRVGLRAFIDPDLAAQHLIEAQIHDRAAPRRGRRPRKIAAAGEK